jgi:hypothetical protein
VGKVISLRRESGRKEARVDEVESTTGYEQLAKVITVGVEAAGQQYWVLVSPQSGGPWNYEWPEWAYELAKEALLHQKLIIVSGPGSDPRDGIRAVRILYKPPAPE